MTTRTTREFTDEAEFNAWHDDVKAALDLPRDAVNAATLQPDPTAQPTTAWTTLVTEVVEVDDNGEVISVAPVTPNAVTTDATHLDDVATLVRADLLTVEELTALVEAFPPWQVGEAVSVGDLRSYDGTLYKCAQAHTTQADWTPDVTPALWVDTAPPDVIPEWRQPTGAHDAYNRGDRVTHNGLVWESTIDANVWEPGVHGWVLV